ncbi:MAG: trypsin-like serine peptidase, partial [Bdellovibrionota bacterium]
MSVMRIWIVLSGAGLVLATVFLAPGCGNGQQPDYFGQSDIPSNSIPAKSLSHAQSLAKNAVVSCSDPANCHESIAFLTETSPVNVSMCTSFLIAPDMVATNSHCIPDDLKAPGSPCTDRIWLTFPKVGALEGVQVGCSQVIFASEHPQTVAPDYAFIQLDQPVQRKVLGFNHDGFADNLRVSIPKINPVDASFPLGSLEVARCKMIQNTYVLPSFDSDLRPTVAFSDCTVMHGNSGSPILGPDGQAHGIMQSNVTNSGALYQWILDNYQMRLEDPGISQLNFGTNFSCVSAPFESARHNPKICSQSGENPVPNASQELEIKLSAAIDLWSAGAEDRLRWKETGVLSGSALEIQFKDFFKSYFDTKTIYVLPVPKCLNKPDSWIETFHRRVLGYPSSTSVAVDLPVWAVSMGLNTYLQAKTDIAREQIP